MMSGPMTTTPNTDASRAPRLPDRARWLDSLSHDEREALGELTLREVDERFGRWRDADAASREAAA